MTGKHFHEDLPTIWHRELVQGAGRKLCTQMKSATQAEMVERMRALPPDGSWHLVKESEPALRADAARLAAQRELSKEMRAVVAAELKARGIKGALPDVAKDLRQRLLPIFGPGMIERHIAPSNWRAVATRWERERAAYRYFTQFVENMVYKEYLFLSDPSARIDPNAQPDLDLMTFLLDADVFVTNEKAFARRAFTDIWRPRGKVLLTSDEFAALVRRM